MKPQREARREEERLGSRSTEPPGEADVSGPSPDPPLEGARMTATKKEVIRERGESAAADMPAGRLSGVGTVRRGVRPRQNRGDIVSPATAPAALSHRKKNVS